VKNRLESYFQMVKQKRSASSLHIPPGGRDAIPILAAN
jgi:hypothetical protein